MGCYVCGVRQTDPARGPSDWRRGVAGGEQVLGCPGCQRSGAWAASLDRCAACGSADLVRRLGETTCRACGLCGDGVAASAPPARSTGERAALADDVAAALDRAFGRSD